jgi:hypothetical protein
MWATRPFPRRNSRRFACIQCFAMPKERPPFSTAKSFRLHSADGEAVRHYKGSTFLALLIELDVSGMPMPVRLQGITSEETAPEPTTSFSLEQRLVRSVVYCSPWRPTGPWIFLDSHHPYPMRSICSPLMNTISQGRPSVQFVLLTHSM